MFHSKLVCPKCGHEFPVKLMEPEMKVIHVTAPGTAITCPSCGATFPVTEGSPKEDRSSQSLEVTFYFCALILVLAFAWWILR